MAYPIISIIPVIKLMEPSQPNSNFLYSGHSMVIGKPSNILCDKVSKLFHDNWHVYTVDYHHTENVDLYLQVRNNFFLRMI